VIPIAHAGHVLVDLLYAAPLLLMLGLLVLGKLRERRARAATDDDRKPRSPDDSLGPRADGV
jgi:hypothetical protein